MDDAARLFRWVFGRFVGQRDEPKISDPEIAALDDRVDTVGGQVGTLAAKVEEIEEKLLKLVKPKEPKVPVTPTPFKTAAE